MQDKKLFVVLFQDVFFSTVSKTRCLRKFCMGEVYCFINICIQIILQSSDPSILAYYIDFKTCVNLSKMSKSTILFKAAVSQKVVKNNTCKSF